MGMFRLALMLLALTIVSGCASVAMDTVSLSGYVAQRRADVLTTGQFSAFTQEALLKIGAGVEDCAAAPAVCRQQLTETEGTAGDQRLAALAEIALYEAIAIAQQADPLRAIEAWLETVRYSYAYLLHGEHHLAERALEDRQIQVRDYYNFSVQQAVALLFDTGGQDHKAFKEGGSRKVGKWTVSLRLPENSTVVTRLPVRIVPASSLSFSGLRSVYRRDGLGAELVAVMPDAEPALSRQVQTDPGAAPRAFQEMPFSAVTVTLSVNADTLDTVLTSNDMVINLFDPYHSETLGIQGHDITLSANFTAGYGMWLAESDFSRQSLWSLLGKHNGIARPVVYLMRPYDPERRVIIMLHGLASSPKPGSTWPMR